MLLVFLSNHRTLWDQLGIWHFKRTESSKGKRKWGELIMWPEEVVRHQERLAAGSQLEAERPGASPSRQALGGLAGNSLSHLWKAAWPGREASITLLGSPNMLDREQSKSCLVIPRWLGGEDSRLPLGSTRGHSAEGFLQSFGPSGDKWNWWERVQVTTPQADSDAGGHGGERFKLPLETPSRSGREQSKITLRSLRGQDWLERGELTLRSPGRFGWKGFLMSVGNPRQHGWGRVKGTPGGPNDEGSRWGRD